MPIPHHDSDAMQVHHPSVRCRCTMTLMRCTCSAYAPWLCPFCIPHPITLCLDRCTPEGFKKPLHHCTTAPPALHHCTSATTAPLQKDGNTAKR